MICLAAWFDRSPIPLTIDILTLSITFMTLTGLAYCYYSIVKEYMGASKNANFFNHFTTALKSRRGSQSEASRIETMNSPDSNPKVDDRSFLERLFPKRTKQELQLLLRAIMITGGFIIFWTPYMLLIIVEVATGSPIPSGWDKFCCLCATSNSLFNQFSLYFFDSRIKSGVHELLGIKSGNASNPAAARKLNQPMQDALIGSITK
jgi:hypothetical protein